MFVFKTVTDLQQHLNLAGNGKRIGFVPTMGALHEGHMQLIKESRNKQCYTVCSIFVNPTQFNNAADLEKYPVSIENDMKLLDEAGCDVLFLPTAAEMYGDDITADAYDYGAIAATYEGEKRPGHFDGVITIVGKLFTAVEPDEVFFGQKDLQQCMVIRHLVKTDFPFILFNMIPTYREENGLAASSRNRRLTQDQKEKASNIYKGLLHAKQLIKLGHPAEEAIDSAKKTYLADELFNLEYFDLVDANLMQKAVTTEAPGEYALVIACWCADVRLIDNVLLTD